MLSKKILFEKDFRQLKKASSDEQAFGENLLFTVGKLIVEEDISIQAISDGLAVFNDRDSGIAEDVAFGFGNDHFFHARVLFLELAYDSGLGPPVITFDAHSDHADTDHQATDDGNDDQQLDQSKPLTATFSSHSFLPF
jgi:hypothetical protein